MAMTMTMSLYWKALLQAHGSDSWGDTSTERADNIFAASQKVERMTTLELLALISDAFEKADADTEKKE